MQSALAQALPSPAFFELKVRVSGAIGCVPLHFGGLVSVPASSASVSRIKLPLLGCKHPLPHVAGIVKQALGGHSWRQFEGQSLHLPALWCPQSSDQPGRSLCHDPCRKCKVCVVAYVVCREG